MLEDMQAFCAESSLCDLYQKGVHSFHSNGQFFQTV